MGVISVLDISILDNWFSDNYSKAFKSLVAFFSWSSRSNSEFLRELGILETFYWLDTADLPILEGLEWLNVIWWKYFVFKVSIISCFLNNILIYFNIIKIIYIFTFSNLWYNLILGEFFLVILLILCLLFYIGHCFEII